MTYCPYCMHPLNEQDGSCPACGKAISEYHASPHTLPQGAMLNNRYRIGGVIGEGGFGITYIGLDTLLEVRVAVKEFYPNGMVNRNNTVSNAVHSISTETARELFSKSRENFLREARTLAKFTGEPGIVAVRDFFEENHTVYIVMEYLDGITLKQYLAQVGRISPYNTVCLLMPVFRSLQKIHEKGLIHRDISPDNIMLVDEEVKLLDFGAAREFADEKSLSVMLKHGYAPMEQYRRHGVQGAWTDVYAICATMYKCVTGKIPPDAPDRVFEDELKMPSALGIEMDPAFEDVLRRGLAVKPDERIQSIAELLQALDAVPDIDIGEPVAVTEAPKAFTVTPTAQDSDGRLSEYVPHRAGEPEPAAVPTPQPQPEEPKKKSKLPLILGIAGGAVVAAGVAVAVILLNSGSKPAVVRPTEPSAATVAATQATQATEATKETFMEIDPSELKYPDLGNYFHLDNDFLTMDESLFGMETDAVARLFASGDLFWAAPHPDFGSGYSILSIPVDSPVNVSQYVQTIDLIFKNNRLVATQYETRGDFNNEMVTVATARFGNPVSQADKDVRYITDGGATYRLCMTHYDDERFDVKDVFAQRYYASGETP